MKLEILKMLEPFAEAFATQLVGETAPKAREIGKDGGRIIRDLLLGTKTTADDTLVKENAKAIAEGFIEGLYEEPAPATDAGDQPQG